MVYSARRFVVCLSVCHFVLVFFSPFTIAITSLGEERANLSAFRTFCSVCAYLDLSVSSSSWGLGRAAVCVSVLRVASGPRVKLASCKSALNTPVVYSTDRSKAVVPVLVLLFGALWFILRGDSLYVLSCVILFLGFSVLLALRLPRLGKRES